MFGIDDAAAAMIGAGIIGTAGLGSSAISAASQQAPSSTTHQAKLNLKYGKLYDEWSARNLPSLNRQGMEAAGFNPILAYSQGTTGHGMGSVSGAPPYNSIGNADFGSDVSSAVQAYFDIRSRQNQLAQQEANINLTNAQSGLSVARTAESLDNVENPNGLWKSMSHNMRRAADFWFGANSAERMHLLPDWLRKWIGRSKGHSAKSLPADTGTVIFGSNGQPVLQGEATKYGH